MRTTDNDSAIYTTRTARTEHRCESLMCGRVIQPGEKYSRAALPPWTDVNTSDSWWVLKVCLHCRSTTEPEEARDE